MGSNGAIKSYKKYTRSKVVIIIFLAFATLLMMLVAISMGSSGLSTVDIILALFGKGTVQSNAVVWNLRLPRVITAVAGGIGLAAVGCVMQNVLRNPLASSSTLGVSQGAAFGASVAIICLGAGLQNQTADAVTIINPYLISICALIGSMLSTFVVLGLSRFRRVTPEAMVLSGVALSALFSGGTTLLQYFADDVKIAAVVFWTFGDLGRTSWREIAIIAVVVILALIYFLINRWNYNALESGEHSAAGLGVNVDLLRLLGMIVCSFTAAVIVSFVGIINFIGLIAPHVMRKIIGNDYRYLLPAVTGRCINAANQ